MFKTMYLDVATVIISTNDISTVHGRVPEAEYATA
jgi:hypothetical protein